MLPHQIRRHLGKSPNASLPVFSFFPTSTPNNMILLSCFSRPYFPKLPNTSHTDICSSKASSKSQVRELMTKIKYYKNFIQASTSKRLRKTEFLNVYFGTKNSGTRAVLSILCIFHKLFLKTLYIHELQKSLHQNKGSFNFICLKLPDMPSCHFRTYNSANAQAYRPRDGCPGRLFSLESKKLMVRGTFLYPL